MMYKLSAAHTVWEFCQDSYVHYIRNYMTWIDEFKKILYQICRFINKSADACVS